MPKLMLIDGNSILNRGFYGILGETILSASDGTYTNAVYGFLNIFLKHLAEDKPDYVCVAFDLRAPTFRHKEYEHYKAHRKGMPDELASQVPIMKEVLDAMNVSRIEIEGFEADDIIGTMSLLGEKEGLDVIIVTGDKDALQLISDKTTVKLARNKGSESYNPAKMQETYGMTPTQFIDLKALMGDSSDNIPGVPGVGEKTALSLIQKFGSLEKIYEDIEQVEKPKLKASLIEHKDLAFLCRRLATIDRNVPCCCPIENTKKKDFNKEKLLALFKRLEFTRLIDKLGLGTPVGSGSKPALKPRAGLEPAPTNALAVHYEIGKFIEIQMPDNKTLSMDWMEFEEGSHIESLRPALEDENIKKYGHNIKPLIVYLKRRGIELRGLAFDTALGAYILNPADAARALPGLAHEYLKEEVTSSAELILQLAEIQKELIQQNGQTELYYNVELPLVQVLADMEYYGFKIDAPALIKLGEELAANIHFAASEIYKSAGEEFNINSPKQLAVILFEKLKLPVFKKTKSGYSTDIEVLEQLLPYHEVIPQIIYYRQLSKLKSTYVDGLLAVTDPITGKIHSSFNQTVTVTGRISSTEPNLQNIPVRLDAGREIRKVFIPENDGFILTDADYSQIELRVLAHIAGDQNMIAAFKSGEDIHTATASKVFGVTEEDVTPLLRARAKAVNFGIVYGIGDFSLSKDLKITKKEAKQYIDEYLDKYPGVRNYMHDTVERAKKDGYVTTLFGRRRYLPELASSNHSIRAFGERVAMNTPIQGTAADIIKIAMVNVHNELKKQNLKSRLILQVHDELIIETLKEEKDQVKEILERCMKNAADFSVPLEISVKSGHRWYDTK